MQTLLQFEPQVSGMNGQRAQIDTGAIGLPGHDDINQDSMSEAERALLNLADYVYAHTSLKPMSKALFFISRCLLVARKGMAYDTVWELADSYVNLCASLGTGAPFDDFDFRAVLSEVQDHIPTVGAAVTRIATLTAKADSLGLAFNTLLRGKFESGEGLGTFLTPEEVVEPMIRMAVSTLSSEMLKELAGGQTQLLFGDICGGTGRFVYSLYRLLRKVGGPGGGAEDAARLFDQSSLAVELGRLNFLFDDVSPRFECVNDSLTAPSVSKLRDQFALLATNPPFGTGKYKWTPGLSSALSPELLRALGLRGPSDFADPSELFLFRNLDLLAPGGTLAIVLPDGITQSRRFINALKSYEDLRNVHISLAALVSLPVTTFALGGTVAKTSFMVICKTRGKNALPMYVATAKHVGFVKRGNRRAPDARGNDLSLISDDFLQGNARAGVRVDSWRSFERLIPAAICHVGSPTAKSKGWRQLGSLVDPIKKFQSVPRVSKGRHLHVSVLDIDETGLIDVIGASKNRPVSRVLSCEPGDILVSCINPKIWRATFIPRMAGMWTCSPEFLVLRPKQPEQGWEIYCALHRGSVIRAAQSLAGGTSSSRQRVEKEKILQLQVPLLSKSGKAIARHVAERVKYYEIRLREAVAYAALHQGDESFTF